MRKSVKVLGGLLLFSTIVGNTVCVNANNSRDSRFDFIYICDGGDEYTDIRTKEDDSCSYVKCDNRSEGFDAIIRGAKNSSVYSGEECSSMETLKPGEYKYIKNSVHKKYKYAILAVTLSSHVQDWSKHRLGGWWSPDNYRGIK